MNMFGYACMQDSIVVLLGSVVCVIEGWSLVELIQSNVAKMNTGIQ